MVSPLVYDLTVSVAGADIAAVYGSPQHAGDSAEVMNVTTLFPSRREDNRTEGGVILLELGDAAENLTVRADYETTDGQHHTVTRNVSFAGNGTYYDSSGVRKAIAIAEYATLMRNWMAHERSDAFDTPAASEGIERHTLASEWEQRSVDLRVSAPYDERIPAFVPYFRAQMDALGAERMERDLAILRTLVNHTASTPGTVGGTATGTATGTGTAGTATGKPPSPTAAGLGVGPLALAGLAVLGSRRRGGPE
jgi:Ca-activated chloride channel family protein